jgi:[acyl-carrier-protein] S-malonyltransferase
VDKVAFLFPGQGVQSVGMGKDLYDAYPRVRDLYDRAAEALEFDLAALCFSGPEEKLAGTQYSQPAILVTSLAVLEVVRNETSLNTVKPVATAGLSLGEYTALAYAGALRFEDAVKLVWRRGNAMHEAGLKRKGGMLSVVGLDEAKIAEVVAKAKSAGYVTAANFNSPEQVVLSGEPAGLDEADRVAKETGARLTVKLNVSGAFHSELMAPAAEELQRALAEVEISKPNTPVVSNVTGEYFAHPEQIREMLVRQLTHPVQWSKSMQRMIADGVNRFFELGPGRVLAGLLRRIDRGVPCDSVNSVEDIKRLG